MGKKPKLNVDKEEFIAMYKNHNQYEVASHFDICIASVHKLRKRFGLPMRRKLFYTTYADEFMRLHTEGVLLKDIAKKLKISRSHVYYVRKQLGLPYRHKAWEKKLDAKNNT
jgi:hypothetical protein